LKEIIRFILSFTAPAVAALLTMIIISTTMDKVYALQEVAGPLIVNINPGETKSFLWGLVPERNESNVVNLYADGNGSQFLTFPRNFDLVLGRVNYVPGNVSIPFNYANGSGELDPTIHASLSEKNETAEFGANAVNLEVSKVLSIVIGDNKTETKNLPTSPGTVQQGYPGFTTKGTINSLITTPVTKWIATGNWSMNVNAGNLTYFETNMTWYNSSGTAAHTHEFLNFKADKQKPVSFRQPGNNLFINGSMDVGTNQRVVWKDVPSTIEINGKKTISISVDDNYTNHHFVSQPILGVVNSFVLCADLPGPNMEILPPCTPSVSSNGNVSLTSSASDESITIVQSISPSPSQSPPIMTSTATNSSLPSTQQSQSQSGNLTSPSQSASMITSPPPVIQSSNDVTANIVTNNISMYENTSIGLKVGYPSNWVLKPGRVVNPSLDIVAVLSPQLDNDSAFTVAVQKFEPGATIAEYANNTINNYRTQIPEFQPTLFNTHGMLAGNPAYEIDGTYVDDRSTKRQLFEFGTALNNKLYLFQFDAAESKSPSYIPAVGDMIRSLQIAPIAEQGFQVNNTTREEQNEIESTTTCRNITIAGADASGFEKDPKDYNPPEHAIDNDMGTWWSNKGVPSWFQISLAEPVAICSVDVAWNKGNERTYDFTVSTSSDGQSFTDIFTGKSSGKTLSYENYDLQNSTSVMPSDVKFIKLSFTVSSSKVGWVGIREAKVSGR
jgi:hypothetical protein